MKVLLSLLVGACLVAGPTLADEPNVTAPAKDPKVCIKMAARTDSRVRPMVCKKQSEWDAVAKARAEAAKSAETSGTTTVVYGDCGGAGGSGGATCNLTPEPPQ